MHRREVKAELYLFFTDGWKFSTTTGVGKLYCYCEISTLDSAELADFSESVGFEFCFKTFTSVLKFLVWQLHRALQGASR